MKDEWTSLSHTENSRMWKRMAGKYVNMKAAGDKLYGGWGDAIERPLPDLLYTMDEHDLGEIE